VILGDFNKVLVIDENFNEVKELISYLNQKGVANFYFDGEQSSLPAKRLCGIRAIFLDIELKGMEGQNKKTMASKIIGVLDNILHKDNGPFIIFFWSKHGKPYADEVVKRCYENHMSLCGYLTLDKKPDNRQVINQIDQKITTYLQEKLGLFTLIKWECALTKGGTSYINEISQLADPSSKDWSTNYLHLLVWLGNKYRNISMDLGNENENKESIIISDVFPRIF
jgi:hypothetical protein